ncbi:hypothetical protein AJ79_07115 [Helicocarpus griseus UAMH5409]|uniref:Uncharacterized protein n=1 Tax=Helicocarpus griseus UAMH5409 TaxID=1447875 RepID=A0A2B7X5W2_9EURO|nr:hypothetical protein AJ79_07115 [Helicocarpus griseus UAMH5409]
MYRQTRRRNWNRLSFETSPRLSKRKTIIVRCPSDAYSDKYRSSIDERLLKQSRYIYGEPEKGTKGLLDKAKSSDDSEANTL